MLKTFGIIVGVLVVGLLVLISTRPAEFSIERSSFIKASPAQVEALLTDLHAWEGWSPWAKLDPKMKTTYSGAASGVGAVYEWASDEQNVGSGRMTITEVVPAQRVGVKLEFLKPFEATNVTEFLLATDGEVTRVVWRLSGTNNFMSKAFSLVMNMDQLVGGDFERGLAALKALAEANVARAAAAEPAVAEPAAPGESASADAGVP